MKRRMVISIMLCTLTCSVLGQSQKLMVRSLTAASMDITASQNERKALDGKSCALLKVSTVDDIVQTSGNIGNIEERGTEKWIYLHPDTHQLTLTPESHAPLTINFTDYGIGELQAKSTYELVLVEDDRQIKSIKVGDIAFNMVLVDGGSFFMEYIAPHPAYNREYKGNKGHRVTLSSFMIGETEVTQALWQAVMGSNPSQYQGHQNPVDHVSWNDCQKFIAKLNKLTGLEFRLPTEAEWEFAARGGRKSMGTLYSGGENLNLVAWWRGNSKFTTHPVAQKLPNELGLYDMSGNVSEWCHDWYDVFPPSMSPQRDPQGPDKPASWNKARTTRGGSAISYSQPGSDCFVHDRNSYFWIKDAKPNLRSEQVGFRLALSVKH